MSKKKVYSERVIGMLVISFLIISLFTPLVSFLSENTTDNVKANEMALTSSGDNWNIDTTVYLNGSAGSREFKKDCNINIKNGGQLNINNATLSLTVDGEGHTWNISIENGGVLKLWNSTIKTQPRDSQLRPFLKTDITAEEGSKIFMEHNSSFRFPGFVHVDNSILQMVNSSFDKLNNVPEYDYLWDGTGNDFNTDLKDNQYCPILSVTDNSEFLMENSEINNYYKNENFPDRDPDNILDNPSARYMKWFPLDDSGNPLSELEDNEDDEYYSITSGGDPLKIDKWYLYNPMVPEQLVDEYPYINPINRISSLYLQIDYETEVNYSNEDPLEYYSPENSDWHDAFTIKNTTRIGNPVSDSADVWEIDLSKFNIESVGGVKRLVENLSIRLYNNDTQDESAINVNGLRLISAYNNDINIHNSKCTVINSHIDVDYVSSDIDPREDQSTVTDNTTWMQDSKMSHSVLRMIDSEFKSYGLTHSGDRTSYGDPLMVLNDNSKNNTWIYRWLTVKVTDNEGRPLPGASLEANPAYYESTDLINRVNERNNIYNNPEAWSYLNETGYGRYDIDSGRFIANDNGLVTLFLASDRINQPEDWPNSKFVGNYELDVTYRDDSQEIWKNSTQAISLSSFPAMNRSVNHKYYNFEMEVPLPDIAVQDTDLKLISNGESPNFISVGDTLEINLTMHNIGDWKASDFDVSFYLNDTKDSNLLDTIHDNSIDVGGNKSIEIQWEPTHIGNYNILAMVDPDDKILELNESNNVASNSINVGNKPDLFVDTVFIEPSDRVLNRTSLNISARIGNIGGSDVSNVEVSFSYNSSENPSYEHITTEQIDIPGNNSFVSTGGFEWDYPGLGNYTLNVTVDPNGVIDEMNESNNEKYRDIDVYSYPDLRVEDRDFTILSGSSIVRGNKLDMELTVHNVGDVSADDINVSFYLDIQTPDRLIAYDTIPSLSDVDSTTIQTNWTTDILGPHNIIAVVDPSDEITEINETDNEAQTPIMIYEKPDLTVESINSQKGFEVMNNTDLTLNSTISNIGGSDVENVEVRFTAIGETTETVIGSVRVDVQGNSSTTVSPNVNWNNITTGSYEILVEVDPAGEIDELNEDNNNLSRTLNVLSEPDLTPVDFTVSEDMIVENDILYMGTKVKNQGGWPAEDINVSFYVDKGTRSEILVHKETISQLTSGEESALISTQWEANISIERLRQIRTISVHVSEDMETVTDNNHAEKEVTVYKEAKVYFNKENTTYSPDRLIQKGQEVNFSFEIINSGGWNGTVDVTLFDGEKVESNIVNQTFIYLENATINETYSIKSNIGWSPTERGYHDLHLVIGYENGIKGEDELSWTIPIFSENYGSDIIVSGSSSETYTDEYGLSGFVVVEDSGTLTIGEEERTTMFRLEMDRDGRYGIIVRDDGRLIIDNAEVYSPDHEFEIILLDDAELIIRNESNMRESVNLRSVGEKSPNIRIEDSTVSGDINISGGNLHVDESEFSSNNININPDEVYIRNSTFEAPLDDFVDTRGELIGIDVPNNDIAVTGEGEIYYHRWIRFNVESNGSYPLENAEITMSSRDTDYSITGHTDAQGVVYLSVLTNRIMSENQPVHNYEIYGNYMENYEYGPIGKYLETYVSSQTIDITFDDVKFPDLYLNERDISFSQGELTAGDVLWINTTVRNQGLGTAQDVEVIYWLMTGDQTYTEIGSESINELAPSGISEISYEWSTEMTNESMLDESRTIKIEINPDMNPLNDIDPSNNNASSTVLIKSPPSFEFTQNMELLLDGTSYEQKTINEMDVLTIKAQNILNSGGTDVRNASLKVTVDDITLMTETIDLNSMGTYNLSHDWEVNLTGSQTITVWIQSSKEDPEYSNHVSKDIEIEPVEISITSINLPKDPKPNQDISVSGVIENDEGKSLEGIRVSGYLVNDKGNKKTSTKSALTNDNGYFMMTFKTPSDGGKYKVVFEPDVEGSEQIQSDKSFEVQTDEFPWWIVIAVVVIAIAAVAFVILYLTYFGAGEYVECGNCGATIPADSKKCPKCGVEFDTDTVKCSECGEWIPADADICPECGAEFITTGEEVEEYTERMKNQYQKYKDKFRRKAEDEMEEELTDEEFMEWWKDQPSYLTFDEWLEREEIKRKEGSIECPECGALNSVDAAVCQKCGSTLIELEEEPEEEEEEELPEEEEGMEEELAEEDEEPKETELEEKEEEKTKKVRRVKKKPKKKRVKKKVIKKPSKKESEEKSEEEGTAEEEEKEETAEE